MFSPIVLINDTYPMANVRQSADGARAVTAIWSMVRAEMCSDVVGSKSIMFPWVLPKLRVSRPSKLQKTDRASSPLTKCNIAIPHPGGSGQVLVRREASHLLSGHYVPHDGSLTCIVADHQPSSAQLALVVHGQYLNLVRVPGKPSFYGQRVVMAAHDRVSLRVEEHGSRRRGRVEVPQYRL